MHRIRIKDEAQTATPSSIEVYEEVDAEEEHEGADLAAAEGGCEVEKRDVENEGAKGENADDDVARRMIVNGAVCERMRSKDSIGRFKLTVAEQADLEAAASEVSSSSPK